MARLFVAAWPPTPVLEQLAALSRTPQPGVRWTRPDQWHVTLRFLGECDREAASAALVTLRSPVAEAVLGPVPGRLGRDALVLPVTGLDQLAAHVAAATAGVGRPPDQRPFHGHLTLARLRGVAACGLTDRRVAARFPVDRVALVESRLHPDGARYETLLVVPLDSPDVHYLGCPPVPSSEFLGRSTLDQAR